MPKYYCDYCDTFLTHDSPSVRKTHNGGRKHKENVRMYYQRWMEDQAQKLVDATAKAFASGGGARPSAPPPSGLPPPMIPPSLGPPGGGPQGGRPPMMPPPHMRGPMPFPFPPGMPPPFMMGRPPMMGGPGGPMGPPR